MGFGNFAGGLSQGALQGFQLGKSIKDYRDEQEMKDQIKGLDDWKDVAVTSEVAPSAEAVSAVNNAVSDGTLKADELKKYGYNFDENGGFTGNTVTRHAYGGQVQDTEFTPSQQRALRDQQIAKIVSGYDPVKGMGLRSQALQAQAAQNALDDHPLQRQALELSNTSSELAIAREKAKQKADEYIKRGVAGINDWFRDEHPDLDSKHTVGPNGEITFHTAPTGTDPNDKKAWKQYGTPFTGVRSADGKSWMVSPEQEAVLHAKMLYGNDDKAFDTLLTARFGLEGRKIAADTTKALYASRQHNSFIPLQEGYSYNQTTGQTFGPDGNRVTDPATLKGLFKLGTPGKPQRQFDPELLKAAGGEWANGGTDEATFRNKWGPIAEHILGEDPIKAAVANAASEGSQAAPKAGLPDLRGAFIQEDRLGRRVVTAPGINRPLTVAEYHRLTGNRASGLQIVKPTKLNYDDANYE